MKHHGIDRVGREIPLDRAQRGCFEKKEFESRNHARDYAARKSKEFPATAKNPYHCHVCGKWHLTKLTKDAQAVARSRNWKQGDEPKKGG